MSKIIAFTGLRGHGKDTAARALVRDYGYVQVNFADPLRKVCNLVYGVTFDEMLDPVLKEKALDRWPYKSPRELLQQIGTDMFRAYIDDTWVQAWKNEVTAILEGRKVNGFGGVREAAGVVCSDCRFLNEAAMIASLGGTLIKIEDPRKRAKLKLDERSLHQSEVEIDQLQVNWTITNDRGIRDLELAATCFADA
ncbi:putative dNMP kinase [Caulobacter phage CcrColossus]|uniref:Putative dNMP kinase n=1 Tax=Caulobacter phage CcrColossus TaxID=1211640 RepID=K4K684_9CAUD|nr:putative dNMP kinase [Caulobacter phage CcrColossus]AFU88022.1 putative dNMP kinase [Caulobacter phage CcrColossus]